ncbi:MAG: IS701 family transposase [bacterium]
MLIVSIPDILLKCLEVFKPCFSKPQFENFCFYVIGLILCLESRNIQDINKQLGRNKDQSSLNRFITESPWLNRALRRNRRKLVKIAISNSNAKRVYLIIDDTVIDKTGKHIERVGYYHSTTSERRVLGHNLVTAICVIDDYVFPFEFFPYIKEEICKDEGITFHTKIELCIKLIKSFMPPKGVEVIVIGDSWYCCESVIKAIKDKGFQFSFSIKSNRIVYYNGQKYKVSELAKAVSYSQYSSPVKISEKEYSICPITVDIPKIGSVSLVLNKEITATQTEEDIINQQAGFIISSQLNWSGKWNLETYLKRVLTETFYRDSKQHIGLGQYQMRKFDGIIRHWHLVFTAYILLIVVGLQLEGSKKRKTIGEICNLVRDLFFKELLIWSYQQGKNGKTIDSVLTNL